MSTPVKLAAFAAVIGLVFGAATLIGAAAGPDREGSRAKPAMEKKMSSHEMTADSAPEVRGLTVSERGLSLALERTELARGRETELRFTVRDALGHPVRDFALEHEKRLHLIVVRRDGSGFQHLHPRLGRDGTWSTRLTLPEAGSYRVFADFKRGGRSYTLAADLAVDGRADYRALPAPAGTATTGGYRVTIHSGAARAGREADLAFSVERDGHAIRTEPYLGAAGHLVALREGDLAYLHVHPAGAGSLSFMTEFPSAGRYRLYLQFKHEGRVHTAAFTQEVGL